MIKPLIFFAIFCGTCAAQTIGQYELRKRTATGFTAFGITLTNGQVLGQTAGLPAAITLTASTWGGITGTLSAQTDLQTALDLKLAATLAASTYQPLDADLTSIAALTTAAYGRSVLATADAAALRTLAALGSVENTALSTWPGSGNLTTSGTITSGTWSGSFGAVSGANLTTLNATNISSGSLDLARLAQGGATSGQALAWSGSAWAPASIASGLTIGTTTITSGTSGRVLYNNAGTVGELATTGSGSVVLAAAPTLSGTVGFGASAVSFTTSSIGADALVFNLGYGALAVTQTGGGDAIWNRSFVLPLNGYLRYGFSGGTDPILTATASNLTLTQAVFVASIGVKAGTNGTTLKLVKHGTAVLIAGTVTVSDSDTAATGTPASTSRILVTRMTDGGTLGTGYSITRINTTSFTITSSNAAETSTLSWLMINP